MAESMHSPLKLRSCSLCASASWCAPCSGGWVTQESRNGLGWKGPTNTRTLKVAGVRHSNAILWAVQFPVLSPSGRIYLTCRCQLTAFVMQCICEKGTEIMTVLATLPPELQPIPSLEQFLFFKSRKMKQNANFVERGEKNPLTIKLKSDVEANNQYPVNKAPPLQLLSIPLASCIFSRAKDQCYFLVKHHQPNFRRHPTLAKHIANAAWDNLNYGHEAVPAEMCSFISKLMHFPFISYKPLCPVVLELNQTEVQELS